MWFTYATCIYMVEVQNCISAQEVLCVVWNWSSTLSSSTQRTGLTIYCDKTFDSKSRTARKTKFASKHLKLFVWNTLWKL